MNKLFVRAISGFYGLQAFGSFWCAFWLLMNPNSVFQPLGFIPLAFVSVPFFGLGSYASDDHPVGSYIDWILDHRFSFIAALLILGFMTSWTCWALLRSRTHARLAAIVLASGWLTAIITRVVPLVIAASIAGVFLDDAWSAILFTLPFALVNIAVIVYLGFSTSQKR